MSKSIEHRIERKVNRRNRKGLVGPVFCCLIMLIVIMLACLGVDIAHCVHVQAKLQAATDAGALAGVVEIAKNQPTAADSARAYEYAMTVTGSNEADNIYFKNDNPDTTVNVYVNTTATPKTVTVVAARRVNSVFASLLSFGNNGTISFRPLRPDALFVQTAWASDAGGGASSWLGTKSTAAPFLIESVYPYQIVGMIPSLDVVPTSGPAEGQKIANILNSTQPFHLAWNPQKDKNVGWVKAWLKNNDTQVKIGETWRLQNGVVNSTLSSFHVGDTIGIPVTEGDVPMNDDRVILGIVTVDILAIDSNSMTVKMHEPILFHGVKGTPNVTTSTANKAFLQKWQPWTVQLID